jgi:hypothetical protein
MHLGSVLCSTVASDPHYKVISYIHANFSMKSLNSVPQVIKSACLAARCVPSSAIIPKGVKDVASRSDPSIQSHRFYI